MNRYSLLLLMILIVTVGVVTAQDGVTPDADPSLGTIQLAGEDAMNPFFISLTTVGDLDASELGEGCTGYVSAEPNIVVDWSRDADLLRLFFYSIGDATLAVITPDGDVLCNDDYNGTLLDPLIDIEDPIPGSYAVYVGRTKANPRFPGFLVATTFDAYDPSSVNLNALVPRYAPDVEANELPVSVLNISQQPLTGVTLDIASGFGDQMIEFAESGQLPLFDIETGNDLCTGFVEVIPTLAFNWSGDGEQIHIFAEGDHDSTLMVYTPSGEFICNDDSALGGENLNPSLTVETPEEGRYVIYVGSFAPGEQVSGSITITEDLDAQPEPLTTDNIVIEGD